MDGTSGANTANAMNERRQVDATEKLPLRLTKQFLRLTFGKKNVMKRMSGKEDYDQMSDVGVRVTS